MIYTMEHHFPFDGFNGHVCCFKRYLRGFEGTEERVKVGDVLKVPWAE